MRLLTIVLFYGFTFISNADDISDQFIYHLGPKTPYRFAENLNDTKVDFEGCVPQKIWMLIRHGTRNPSEDFIKKMQTRLPLIRDMILASQPEKYAVFEGWKPKVKVTHQKMLVHEGEDEMIKLAERMQARFPSLLSIRYSNTSYYFKHTATQRAKSSAQYFAIGLFGRQILRDLWLPKPIKHDPLLRFYKSCKRWKVEVKHNAEAYREKRIFESSPVMLETVENLNMELKLKEKLTLEDAYLMYMTCAFEVAWKKNSRSPWCLVFSLEDFKVLEFAQDLKNYYKDGYGYEITYKIACPLVKDIVNYFDSESEYPKVSAYFSHSGTVTKLLTRLGLYKDSQHLLSSDFGKDNKWRKSKIDPFGSNIAFVLFKCGNEKKIAVLHQERLVKLPGCDYLCNFEDIKQYYSASINNCDLNETCNIN